MKGGGFGDRIFSFAVAPVPRDSQQGGSYDTEGAWTVDLPCLFLVSAICNRGDKLETK